MGPSASTDDARGVAPLRAPSDTRHAHDVMDWRAPLSRRLDDVAEQFRLVRTSNGRDGRSSYEPPTAVVDPWVRCSAMGRHRSRVTQRLPWIGGTPVVYTTGTTIVLDDREVPAIVHCLEATDDHGRAVLDRVRGDEGASPDDVVDRSPPDGWRLADPGHR